MGGGAEGGRVSLNNKQSYDLKEDKMALDAVMNTDAKD